MTKQLMRIGIENTIEMKRPLLSKYCCLVNFLSQKGKSDYDDKMVMMMMIMMMMISRMLIICTTLL